MNDRATQPTAGIAAAILAGGQASRLGGIPKGILTLPGGLSIIEKTIHGVISAGIPEITIFANDSAPYQDLGLEIAPDRRPGLGPLGGIETALLHYAADHRAVLVLPCDLPCITDREIAALRSAFAETRPPVAVAEVDPCFWHPLCAIVRTDQLPAVSRALDAGRNGVYRLWRALGAAPVHFSDPVPFLNVNTPADLAGWLRGERRPRPEFGPARPLRSL